MAHNLNYNEQTGQYSFFSVKQKAWHGLGKTVQEHPTSKEAIQHAGLDYEVIKSPLYAAANSLSIGQDGTVSDSNNIDVPGYYATMRSDNNTVLGVVGNDYEIVQNADAFTFFDAIVGGGDGILYETAGALGKGERIFITAKLPDYIKVGAKDMIEKFLFLTTSHDGSGSITAAFTPVRIVCQNTLNAAMNRKSHTVRIRHTSNAKQRLEEAHKVIGMSNKLSTELETVFNHWAKVTVTDKEVKRLIQLAMSPNKETAALLRKGAEDELSTLYKNTVDDVFAYAMMNDTQQLETTKGTLFGVYNAVTGYFQNLRNYKNEDAKIKSILMGGTAQIRTQTAFDLCGAFVKNGPDALFLN